LKAKHRKAKLLKKFVKSHIHLTSPYSTLKDMEENEGTMYDVYIIGSDQVWNRDITGCFGNPFFLDFANARKLSLCSINCGSICAATDTMDSCP